MMMRSRSRWKFAAGGKPSSINQPRRVSGRIQAITAANLSPEMRAVRLLPIAAQPHRSLQFIRGICKPREFQRRAASNGIETAETITLSRARQSA